MFGAVVLKRDCIAHQSVLRTVAVVNGSLTGQRGLFSLYASRIPVPKRKTYGESVPAKRLPPLGGAARERRRWRKQRLRRLGSGTSDGHGRDQRDIAATRTGGAHSATDEGARRGCLNTPPVGHIHYYNVYQPNFLAGPGLLWYNRLSINAHFFFLKGAANVFFRLRLGQSPGPH